MSRLGGVLVGGLPGGWDGARTLSVVSTTVLYALAGGAAGYAADRARRAEREISAARAREQGARHLHDGVLQTLAVVQRRTATSTWPAWPAARKAQRRPPGHRLPRGGRRR